MTRLAPLVLFLLAPAVVGQEKPAYLKPVLVVKAKNSPSSDYVWTCAYDPGNVMLDPSVNLTGTVYLDPNGLWGVNDTPCIGYVVRASIQWTQCCETQTSWEYSTGPGVDGGDWKAGIPCNAPRGTQVVVTVTVVLYNFCTSNTEKVAGSFFYTIPAGG